jgi:PAS domain S-box-containing protein
MPPSVALARLRLLLMAAIAAIAFATLGGLAISWFGRDSLQAETLNLVGRQRMLAVRVSAGVAVLGGLHPGNLEARREVSESLKRITEVHARLADRTHALGASIAETPEAIEVLARASVYLADLKAIAEEAQSWAVPGPAADVAHIDRLRVTVRAWVAEMDRLNGLLVERRDDRDTWYARLPLVMSLLTLVTLGFAGRFLGVPALRSMTKAIEALDREHAMLLDLKRRLNKQAERYEVAMTAASMGVWEWDVRSGKLDYDERQFRLFGLEPEKDPSVQTDWRQRVLPDDLPNVERSLGRALRGESQYVSEFRVRHDDGGIRWLSATGLVIRDDAGKPARLVGVNMDVTLRKDAERREREALASLEQAQALARVGSWSFDVVTGQIDWSRQLYVLYGRDPELGPPVYPSMRSNYVDEDAEWLTQRVRRAVENGEGYSGMLRLRDPKNGVAIIQAEAKVTVDATGKTTRIFGTVMDMTATVEREQALRQAQRMAEAASRAKSEFLANMSHEIRTPMAAILGYVDLLDDAKLAREQQREYTATIQRNAKHLLDLINQVLDLSKIEAGHMIVERVACAPATIAREIVSLMRPRAEEKGLRLALQFEGPIPALIHSDPTRLRQVVLNLMGNAIKFTQVGSVELVVSLDRSAGEPQLVLSVKDTGIGIEQDKLGNLFRPFSQADSSTTRRFGGTGLGLSIASHLTRLLGGRIDVTSLPGSGTTFTAKVATGSLDGVELSDRLDEVEDVPLRSHGSSAPPSLQPLSGLRVLLVEDGPDNQKLIMLHLTRAGADVEVLANGQLAVERLCDAAAREFDVVLMDMQMPVLDGYAATTKLRAVGYDGPIIALTAHAMEGDRAKCLQAGCDDYATKPIDSQRLIESILRLTEHAADARERSMSSPQQRPALLSTFQDDPDMLELVEEFSRALPARVEAIEAALSARDFEALRRLAHQLKGAGAGYGYPPITVAAQDVESAVHGDEPAPGLVERVAELSAICRSVEPLGGEVAPAAASGASRSWRARS